MDTNLYFVGLLLLSCGYALWSGGGPERTVAAIFLIGVASTHLAASGAATRFSSVEMGVFIVDVIVLLALLAVALRAERFWTLWVTALQIIGTAGHLEKLADPQVIQRAYAFALAFWSYPMLCLLAVATRAHQRRRATKGHDRFWSVLRERRVGAGNRLAVLGPGRSAA